MAYRKYRNQKTNVDGYTFDSKAESRRYRELCVMQSAGLIRELRLQVPFTLIDAFKASSVNGKAKKFRKTEYLADFVYVETDTECEIVEDVKGARTDVFNLKFKMLMLRYPGLHFRIMEA